MYSTVLSYWMNKTVSKLVKMGQNTLNGVALLHNGNITALGLIGRILITLKRLLGFLNFLGTNEAHTKIIISQRQVKLQSRIIAHFSRLFKHFPHAITCNPSCVEVSLL